MVETRYRRFQPVTLRSRKPKAKASRGAVKSCVNGQGVVGSLMSDRACGKKGGTTDAQLSVLLQDEQL